MGKAQRQIIETAFRQKVSENRTAIEAASGGCVAGERLPFETWAALQGLEHDRVSLLRAAELLLGETEAFFLYDVAYGEADEIAA